MLMSLRHFCKIVEMFLLQCFISGLHSCDKTKIKQKVCFILVLSQNYVIGGKEYLIFMSAEYLITRKHTL